MSEAARIALDQAEAALIESLKAVVEARRALGGNHAEPVSNVKPAPFYLNGASTAAILTGRPGPRIAQVPIEAVELVDQPRPSTRRTENARPELVLVEEANAAQAAADRIARDQPGWWVHAGTLS